MFGAEKGLMERQPATLIYADETSRVQQPPGDDASLWLSSGELSRIAGWELKPAGLCRGEMCVPVTPGAERLVNAADGETWVNLTELARRLGMPVVHDAAHATWFVGEPAEQRREALASLVAPDFELPDLAGQIHRLSDYRGKKVLLAAWASW
jgi:hypothetical protein